MDKKEERKQNLSCALLCFEDDQVRAEGVFRKFRDLGLFDDPTSAFLSGQGHDPAEIEKNAVIIRDEIADIDPRSMAILSTSEDVVAALRKLDKLDEMFKNDLMLELPRLPLSIIARYAQRGVSPTIYQYKLLKNRPEQFDEVSIAIMNSAGDLGMVLERYRKIDQIDSDIPVQAKAALAANPMNLELIIENYKVMIESMEEAEKLGRRLFDSMVAAVLSLCENPKTAIFHFKKHRKALWNVD